MEKLAIGPGYPEGTIDLNAVAHRQRPRRRQGEGRRAVRHHCLRARPRPRTTRSSPSFAGSAAVFRLIPDGDVAGVIATDRPGDRHRHLLRHRRRARRRARRGGAALRRRADAGQAGVPQRRRDRARARRWGIEDLDRESTTLEDMARGDCIFAATGVTDGSLLKGVHRDASAPRPRASSCARARARCAGYPQNIATLSTAAPRPAKSPDSYLAAWKRR